MFSASSLYELSVAAVTNDHTRRGLKDYKPVTLRSAGQKCEMGLPGLKAGAGRAAFLRRPAGKTVSLLLFQPLEAPGILGSWLPCGQSSNARRAFLTSSHAEPALLPLSFTHKDSRDYIGPTWIIPQTLHLQILHLITSQRPFAVEHTHRSRGWDVDGHESACHTPRCSVGRSDRVMESSFLSSPGGFVPCVLLSGKGTQTQGQPELSQSLLSGSEWF